MGRSEIGSQAAASHTGALAGSDRIYEGVFKQSGINRVDTIDELLDTTKAFSMQPLPKGKRVCVLTEAGGPGIICMDELGLSGEVEMAWLSEKCVERLKEILPPMAIINRPEGYIDMSAAAMEKAHAEALEVILNEEGVDAVILISVPPTFPNPEKLSKDVLLVASKSSKPILICLMAGQWVKEARILLEKSSMPTFDLPQRAARALINRIKRSSYLRF